MKLMLLPSAPENERAGYLRREKAGIPAFQYYEGIESSEALMAVVYYNEFDPYAAQWLRNLIRAGHLPEGDVDERSITEVHPSDVDGYDACHFFAGIGGWPLALRLAGVPDDFSVWTGSCPCQPFSQAGSKRGFADERHLWPVWERLIRERRPPVVLGEQVASAIAWGWLDLVASDLEAQGYACGAAVFGAHSVGAPHMRQRLWWMGALGQAGAAGWLGYASGVGRDGGGEDEGRLEPELPRQGLEPFWSRCRWLDCPDGLSRPLEPGLEPLADGVPQRVRRLRAYGNAVVPQAAAAFISVALPPGNPTPWLPLEEGI